MFVRSADLFAGFSEPAFTLLIVVDGFVKFRFTEVRPVGVAEIKFRVSTLPEQVVAQADFSILVTCICLFSCVLTSSAQDTSNTDETEKPVILYSGTPKKYEIADIKVIVWPFDNPDKPMIT